MMWSQGREWLNQYKYQSVLSMPQAKTLPYLPFLYQFTFSWPVFFFHLCHCHCPLPWRWACYIVYVQSLLGPPPPRASDAVNTTTGSPQRLARSSSWPCCSGRFDSCWRRAWILSALLAFRQRGLCRKGLCQELEAVPNNGEKHPNMNMPFVGLHFDKCKWTGRC